jgi:hypothetical protein
MKYMYDDEEDDIYSDSTSARRSTRNTRAHTPTDAGPTVTQSGRQVKARQGGVYGETMLSGRQSPPFSADGTDDELADGVTGRARRGSRNGKPRGGRHIDGYNNVDEMSSDEDDASEQDYGDDEEDDNVYVSEAEDEEEDIFENDVEPEEEALEPKTLIVKLPLKTPTPEPTAATQAANSASSVKENQPPAASSPSDEQSSKPIDIPVVPQNVPTSPLVFRGSPGKPSPFSPSVNAM